MPWRQEPTALPLATTGDPWGTHKLSGKSGEFLLALCILFFYAEKWNAKYVAAFPPEPSNMAGVWLTAKV